MTPGLNVKMYTIWKYVPRQRDYKCPASKLCKDTYPSQAHLNVHVKQKHLNFKWKCSYCLAKYATYNAAYKHECAHSGPTHTCDMCQKSFMNKSRLTEHEHLHTQVGLIPCIGKGCKHQFNIRSAMNAHAITYRDLSFDCDKCDKSFKSPTYLRQHKQGKHEGGFIALCGQIFPWPKPKFYHGEHCTDCMEVDQKREADQKKIQKKSKGINRKWLERSDSDTQPLLS